MMAPPRRPRSRAARGRGAMGVAVLLLASLGAHAQAPDELRVLLDKGDAKGAYELGRRAPQRLGEPAFDLYFGIAAVNAGRPAEGVLALERFVTANPEHDAARLELARGYFLMGDDGRAREEFEAAAARKPAPATARVIEEHLLALRERESRHKPTFAAWIEAAGGYDSNPRAGVDNPVISLPVLGEVTIADTGVRVADDVRQFGFGFRGSIPLTARAAFFLGAQSDGVRYDDEKAFEQSLHSGSAGFTGRLGGSQWRAGASLGYQTLGHDPYRRTHGFFAEWALPLGSRDLVSLGAQGGKLDYQGANDVRDSDFAALALGWKRALALAWQPTLEAGVNVARERNAYAERQDLSRDLYGARVGLAIAPYPRWSVVTGATWQRSDYREPDLVLDTTREDKYAAADVALAWNPWPPLTLRLEYTHARNDSNLALYEYRRYTVMLRGRYEFR